MNWLRRIAQVWSPADIITGVLNNEFDGSGPSISQPEGGWAYQQMKQLGPLPEVCEQINYAAGVNPAARSKMKVLAEAAGCPWTPENPPNTEQTQQPMGMQPMPMLGQQEKPMDMPTAEFE